MKDKMIIVACCVILFSCDKNADKNAISENNTVERNANTEPDNYTDTGYTDSSVSSTQINPRTENNPFIEGKNLIDESNCLSCHKEQEKVVGPAYIEVAKKYKPTKENIKMLTNRIINGSTGIWGTNQMTAHPDLTKEDAEKMVQYILSLEE